MTTDQLLFVTFGAMVETAGLTTSVQEPELFRKVTTNICREGTLVIIDIPVELRPAASDHGFHPVGESQTVHIRYFSTDESYAAFKQWHEGN